MDINDVCLAHLLTNIIWFGLRLIYCCLRIIMLTIVAMTATNISTVHSDGVIRGLVDILLLEGRYLNYLLLTVEVRTGSLSASC